MATFLALALPAHAVLLEYWDFNNEMAVFGSGYVGKFTTNGATAVTSGSNNGEIFNPTTRTLSSNSTMGAVFTNGLLDLSGVNGSGSGGSGVNGGATASPPVWGAYSDSTVNRLAGDTTTGGSFIMLNSGVMSNALTFTLSSTGYTSLTFSSAIRFSTSTTTALATITWAYSTDGTTWVTLTPSSGTPGINSAFGTVTLTLPTAVDNLATFYIKETYDFTSTSGSVAIDNVQLNGTAIAVPEPSSVALVIAGGTVLIWRLRRRSVFLS
ncbi:MAG: PEP-CTERM sorting domain-containing protein [Verrucomicrobium sp.]|nr:PEP-CTERM sorting domain-containing protein [Verrucomicrobium sp.]